MKRKLLSKLILITFILMPLITLYNGGFAESSKGGDKALYDLLFFQKKYLSKEEEKLVARLLQEGAKEYLKELKTVDIKNFKSLSGDNAIALHYAVDSVAEAVGNIIFMLEKPMIDPNSTYSLLAWHSVARNISINTADMDDLERFGLVKSTWHIMIGTVLVGIFEKIKEG